VNPIHYTHEQLVSIAQFNEEDIKQINQCRREYTRLGFGYQIAFVRLVNRFPIQQPFEILGDILTFTSIQLNVSLELITLYAQRQPTISAHQELVRNYLGLKKFGDGNLPEIKEFIFKESCRLNQTSAIIARTEQFLKSQKILNPSQDTLRRLVVRQKQEAKKYIFKKIVNSLPKNVLENLEELLNTKDSRQSFLHSFKQPPGRPSSSAMLKLTSKVEDIKATGILEVDLSWLNNNFQRVLNRYVKHCTASRLRELESTHRYAALVCFLWQTYRDTIDFIMDMYDKLLNKIYNHAQTAIDQYNKNSHKKIRRSLFTFKTLAELVLDDKVEDSVLRQEIFKLVERDKITNQLEDIETWLNGKHSHAFNLVKERISYIRQFSPALLKHLQFISEGKDVSSLLKAINILQEMNEDSKRKLPEDTPLEFIPKKIQPLVKSNGKLNKSAWECALLTAIRDEIKAGNLSIKMSKSFGRLEDFFISKKIWHEMKEKFFNRAGLPSDPDNVKEYLKKRLNKAFDQFLETLPNNPYVNIDKEGWHLKSDSTDKLDLESEKNLENLKKWLSQNMRVIKLPELLIEVDNELKITRQFMSAQQNIPQAEEICAILATIMAHGCNIGPHTMSHLTGINYGKLKHITDWILTEEALRGSLALLVNSISKLDISQSWGTGKTSSSDGQRFSMECKVLQQTYSTKFHDFALEFYSFIADNYAPFHGMPIECTDRDAPYTLDGLLYNESDLPLEEHFIDTHGYTENNFTAFAMLAKRFSPRIRGLHKQRIYRIDTEKDYKELAPLVCRSDRTIHMDWIVDQWDRIGQFYASLECGHATASTAMKRLNGFTRKNLFYRANRELGRIFKTEHILQYMSDKALRQRTRKGLLKGEQLHALARDLYYGKQGRISSRDLQAQRNSCSCLTLILASIIYWQAKEINRVVLECDPEGNNIDLKLMDHISPITWNNVILYGEYVLNKDLVRP
jgi:TnpA family transposase